MELPHLYFDNGLFRKLISEDCKDSYNYFFNLIFGDAHTEYKVIFTWFSLLESIGLGKIKEKRNSTWKPFSLNMAQYRNKLEKAPFEYFEKAKKNYLVHPFLEKNKLIKKIEEQIRYSKNPNAKTLIEDTLERKLEEIKKNYDKCSELIAQNLAWDDTCIFKFINYEQESQKDEARKNYRIIRGELLRIFSTANVDGYVLNSYRLIETIVKELMIPEQINEYNKKMNFDVIKFFKKFSLDKMQDMCDVEVIHLATLGFYENKIKKMLPVNVFSCDKPLVLKNRLAIQQSIIPNLENLNIKTGKIYSVAEDLKKMEEISVISSNSFILPS